MLAYAYGAQVAADGRNITSEALTIWRNAAYKLTGKEVPTTLYENTEAAKKVLVVNQTGAGQGAGASAPGADPVTKMLEADENFFVTYIESDQDGTEIDLTGIDLVIAQETISSGAAMFKPGGKLGVKDVTVPIIYNKSWAFRNGKAITDADASVSGTANLSVTATNTAHPLFSGIDLSTSSDIRLFKDVAGNDDGSVDGGKNKAIDVGLNINFSSAAAGSLALVPEATDAATTMLINYLPSGTQVGEAATDVLGVDAVTFAFSYGAMVMGDGANVSPELLTIWRNAAYMLTYGVSEVPTTLVENAAFQLPKNVLYVNQTGAGQGAGASAPGADPVTKMLEADENFFVTYIESDQDGTEIDLTGIDLVIAQETISSGAAMFKPGGKLGVKDVTVPIIYNKSWAFRNGKAITDADASVSGTANLSVTATNTAHPLFSGIDLSTSSDIRLFKDVAGNDDGSVDGGKNKAIDVGLNINFSSAAAGSLALVPEATDAATTMLINYLPSGTQVGEAATDVLGVDAVTFAFSYGAMVMGDGANVSPELLTIWRNAAYMLTYGVSEVPTTLVENSLFTLSFDTFEKADNAPVLFARDGKVSVSNIHSETAINIFNFTGQLIKSVNTKEDVEFGLNSGFYIARLQNAEGAKALKFYMN